MGVEHSLLEDLSARFEAAIATGEHHRPNPISPTPKDFTFEQLFPGAQKFGLSANHAGLRVANAAFDALIFGAPGTSPARALALIADVLNLQKAYGFMCLSYGRRELWTSSHAQLWDAFMAALLWIVRDCARADRYPNSIAPNLLTDLTAWWRQRFDAWGAHLAAGEHGRLVVLMPCLRGARTTKAGPQPGLATNASQDQIFDFLAGRHGRPVDPANHYFLGLRIWQQMAGLKLPQVAPALYPMPGGVELKRFSYPGGWVSMIQKLEGSDPQWMVGTTKEKPAGAMDVPNVDGWVLFREAGAIRVECPEPPPHGGTLLPAEYWHSRREA